MNVFASDLRHAFRVLRRTPVLSAIAVASLALGIGANTAVYSVVDAVVLRPLPFPSPNRIVAIEEREKDGTPSGTTGWATYADWRARARSFEDVAVASYADYKLGSTGGRDAEKVEGLKVSSGFFPVLGVKPLLGRAILASDDVKGAPRVAVLSHSLWKRRFGSDPSIIGRTVPISDLPFIVVGVLPADFEAVFAPEPQKATEIWSALRYDATLPYACRTCRHLRAFARVKQGVSLASARAEMDAISGALLREHPSDYGAAGAFVTPFATRLTGPSRPILWTLLGAVVFVLLIACANVASLLLGRAAARRREIAIRLALGAARGRIARMLLTESLVLAAAGGALGVAIAAWLLPALVAAAPVALPRAETIRIDPSVLLFALSATLATSVLCGLLPALKMSRDDPQSALRDGGGSGRARSLASMGLLVSFDAAVAFLLLFGASLLVRSTTRLLEVDPGFSPAHAAKLEIDVSGPAYEKDPAVVAYFDRVLERVRAVPGVASAGISSELPLGGNWDGYGIRIEGKEPANPTDAPDALRYGVSPGYLDAMGIPVRRGRGITEADREGAQPVVLVNETFARHGWPGEDPIGKRLRLGDHPSSTIVGIVGDVRHRGLDVAGGNQVYVSAAQWADSSVALVVRFSGGPTSQLSAVRAAIRSVDSDQPITRVASLDRVVGEAAGTHRFAMNLLAAFAGLATLLAAVGIYGVVSGFVGRRTREIGIRIALGASRGSILSLVAGRAVMRTALGLAVGIAAALGAGRILRGLLFEVAPTDGVALVAGAAVVLAVAAAATLWPARRATRVDPIVALRED